jgi:hypothetical protein
MLTEFQNAYAMGWEKGQVLVIEWGLRGVKSLFLRGRVGSEAVLNVSEGRWALYAVEVVH